MRCQNVVEDACKRNSTIFIPWSAEFDSYTVVVEQAKWASLQALQKREIQ